jgi:hypothetical protein
LGKFTVANLPPPFSADFGQIAIVSDAANRTGVVTGGGANIIPVYNDGTTWRSFQD